MRNSKKFTGKENHAITVAEAVVFIRDYKNNYGQDAQAGCFFDKRVVKSLIDQPGAVGMRYYYGYSSSGEEQLVLVGADAARNDLIDSQLVKASISNPPLGTDGNYTGDVSDHQITLSKAGLLTERYQKSLQVGNIKGGFFGKEAIQRLLDHAPGIGIRFFFGARNDGARVMVLMCVDNKGQDLFYGPLAEISLLCPPHCPDFNALNFRTVKRQKLSPLR